MQQMPYMILFLYIMTLILIFYMSLLNLKMKGTIQEILL